MKSGIVVSVAGGLAAWAAAALASATVITGTYTGHAISTLAEQEFPDVWGVDAFGDTIIGDAFTATVTYNLADGVTTAYPGPSYTNLQTPGTSTGTFTIGGHTYPVLSSGGFALMTRSSDVLELTRTDDPGDNTGDFFEVETVSPIDPRLDQPVSITSADLVAAVSVGNAVLQYPGAGVLRANFAIDSISFSATPEPSTWAMLMVGLAAAGAALRSRRVAKVLSA